MSTFAIKMCNSFIEPMADACERRDINKLKKLIGDEQGHMCIADWLTFNISPAEGGRFRLFAGEVMFELIKFKMIENSQGGESKAAVQDLKAQSDDYCSRLATYLRTLAGTIRDNDARSGNLTI